MHEKLNEIKNVVGFVENCTVSEKTFDFYRLMKTTKYSRNQFAITYEKIDRKMPVYKCRSWMYFVLAGNRIQDRVFMNDIIYLFFQFFKTSILFYYDENNLKCSHSTLKRILTIIILPYKFQKNRYKILLLKSSFGHQSYTYL